jgi:ornithine cyclodeaminase/thiomorpholine-carboxylate dehydrogenase
MMSHSHDGSPQPPILMLGAADIMRLVAPAKAIVALAEGFRALTRGEVQAPPRPKIDGPDHSIMLAMLAWAPGQLITQKTVGIFHGNHAIGLASHQALVTLFDAMTGVPVAILDGGSLTGLRTTACAVLSVRELARDDARVALVIGGGVQAEEHVRQLNCARPFEEIRIYARKPEAARRLATLAPNATIAPDLESAVRGADVVCLTTAADAPVIDASWVKLGTHVTSVGYAPPGSEVPAELIERARVFVEAKSAFQPAPVGCAELSGRDPASGAELGEVLLALKPGRTASDEITLYKSMGNAMEDMVIANLAYSEAKRAGAGQMIRL